MRAPRFRLLETRARLVGRGDEGLGHGAPRGLGPVQALGDLGLGAIAQVLIAFLDHRDQPALLARNLVKVLLGELIPPLSEALPDLRPLLGKRLI
jgi:hypothetical protein